MTCIKIPGGFICVGRGSRIKACVVCRQLASLECDGDSGHTNPETLAIVTCDAPLCERCAKKLAGRDLCPEHTKKARAQFSELRRRVRSLGEPWPLAKIEPGSPTWPPEPAGAHFATDPRWQRLYLIDTGRAWALPLSLELRHEYSKLPGAPQP